MNVNWNGNQNICETIIAITFPCKQTIMKHPLRTEFPVFWEFLGILKNSQLCKWPLQTEFPVFWEFLGIPRNSQKFPTMQINSDLKSLELLGISGKGRLQFCEDLESLGIPRNSQLYKLPII